MKNSEALGICCDYLGSLRTVDLIFGKTELYQKDYLYSKGLVTNLCFNIIYLKEYLYLFLRDSSKSLFYYNKLFEYRKTQKRLCYTIQHE